MGRDGMALLLAAFAFTLCLCLFSFPALCLCDSAFFASACSLFLPCAFVILLSLLPLPLHLRFMLCFV